MKKLTLVLSILLLFTSCKKSSEQLISDSINNFMPLEIGKYIVYQLDSTVYTNQGSKQEIRSYTVKDTVLAITTDNLGRKVYRISRLLRSKTDTNTWTNIFTYNAINDSTQLEIIESNQRFIKLKLPIKDGFSWKGNTYINTINNPELQFYDNWNYRYEDVNKPAVINKLLFPTTISVLHQNDTINNPSNKNVYSEINYSREIFAKNIGLIYKEFKHQVWQPPNANNSSGYYDEYSYGLKMSILGHNSSAIR